MPTVSLCHAANISHYKEDAQYTANAAYDVTLERSLVQVYFKVINDVTLV